MRGMNMGPSYAELREMSDDDLVRYYDAKAENLDPGGNFYLDEIKRRAAERAADAAIQEARAARRLATWSAVLAFVAVVVAVLVPFLQYWLTCRP